MKKCSYCKKKLNIVIFSCKCDLKKLCPKCRLPEKHNCKYDFQKEAREKLNKNLPLITPNKIIKINSNEKII